MPPTLDSVTTSNTFVVSSNHNQPILQMSTPLPHTVAEIKADALAAMDDAQSELRKIIRHYSAHNKDQGAANIAVFHIGKATEALNQLSWPNTSTGEWQ